MSFASAARVPAAVLAAAATVAAPAPALATCRTVTYTPPTVAPALRGDLCTPAGGRAREAIVVVHGGGAIRGQRETLDGFASLLRRGRTATLAIDYTLLAPADPGPLYPRPERDIKLAVQWLRAHGRGVIVNPRRIYVLGHSAGARLAAQALVTPDDASFHAAEPTWGVSDRVAGLIGFAGPYSGRLVADDTDTRYFGGPPDSPDPAVQGRRRKADSIAAAARASGPALLFHGTSDTNVPISESIAFVAALRRANQPVTLVRVPGARHIPTPAQGRRYARRVRAWLRALGTGGSTRQRQPQPRGSRLPL